MLKRLAVAIPLLVASALVALAAGPEPSGDSYGEGYAAGCRKGNEDAGVPLGYAVVKDQARYERDPTYKKGWDDGYARCLRDGARRRVPY